MLRAMIERLKMYGNSMGSIIHPTNTCTHKLLSSQTKTITIRFLTRTITKLNKIQSYSGSKLN